MTEPPTNATERGRDAIRPLDVLALGQSLEGPWASVPLAQLPLRQVQLRAMEDRTAPWHIHDNSAEIFFVLEGSFWIDVDNASIQVNQGQWLAVPPGTRHRARATTRVLLMVMDNFA